MDIYRSRRKDRDMKDLVETNKLYEIVRYYGGYLYYCKMPQIKETYDEFYTNNKDAMRYIFINLANAEAKRYFNRYGISGIRMRRMLITKHGKMIRSYEWIAEYVEYILSKCIGNNTLYNTVLHIMYHDCCYCIDQKEILEWKVLCIKRLLGFQYTLLREVGNRKDKISESALQNIQILKNSNFIEKIIENCPIIKEK